MSKIITILITLAPISYAVYRLIAKSKNKISDNTYPLETQARNKLPTESKKKTKDNTLSTTQKATPPENLNGNSTAMVKDTKKASEAPSKKPPNFQPSPSIKNRISFFNTPPQSRTHESAQKKQIKHSPLPDKAPSTL